MNFKPGLVVAYKKTKNGQNYSLRYPCFDDLNSFLQYINKLSREDTYLSLSGELMSLEQAWNYLSNIFITSEKGDGLTLVIDYQAEVKGVCTINRVLSEGLRCRHLGVLGISLSQDFRGQGAGYELSKTVLLEARKQISNLETVTLSVFGDNYKAIKLYKKLGFQEYSRLTRGYFRQDKFQDKVEMFLALENFKYE